MHKIHTFVLKLNINDVFDDVFNDVFDEIDSLPKLTMAHLSPSIDRDRRPCVCCLICWLVARCRCTA